MTKIFQLKVQVQDLLVGATNPMKLLGAGSRGNLQAAERALQE